MDELEYKKWAEKAERSDTDVTATAFTIYLLLHARRHPVVQTLAGLC